MALFPQLGDPVLMHASENRGSGNRKHFLDLSHCLYEREQ